MAPKGIFGRGRGKGKAKAKGGRGKAKAMPVISPNAEIILGEGVDGAVADGVLAIRSEAKPKSSGLRKKIMEELGDKTIEDGLADHKHVLATADATIAEAEALEEAQEAQLKTSQAEYEQAKQEVTDAIDKETAAAGKYRQIKQEKQAAMAKVDAMRHGLMDAQKKVAFLELQAVSDRKMKELEDMRRAAAEAAEAAKKNLLEQRQLEKEALAATKRALEEVRAQKAAGKVGVKRASESIAEPAHPIPVAAEPSPKKAKIAGSEETVPAALIAGVAGA